MFNKIIKYLSLGLIMLLPSCAKKSITLTRQAYADTSVIPFGFEKAISFTVQNLVVFSASLF